jgi:hypothetical protein
VLTVPPGENGFCIAVERSIEARRRERPWRMEDRSGGGN